MGGEKGSGRSTGDSGSVDDTLENLILCPDDTNN